MRKIVIIAHDLRSTHNVGALFRTADCFGVAHLYCSGYTPYPAKVAQALRASTTAGPARQSTAPGARSSLPEARPCRLADPSVRSPHPSYS